MKKHSILSIAFMLIFAFTDAQHTVVLYGTCADTSIHQMRYYKINPFRWSEINPDSIINVSRINNHFKIKLYVQHPQLIGICPPGYSWSQTTYITSGDSVSFQIVPISTKNQYEIVFSGENAAQYNYAVFIKKAFDFKRPWFKKGTDLNQYKHALLAYKKRQMDSVMHYIHTHIVSKDFRDYAKAEIDNEYVYNLFTPIDNKLVSIHDLPSGYLQDAILEKNKVSHAYKVALAYKYIYDYTHSPISNLDSVYTNIVHNFSGQDRAYLLSAMIGYYALKQKPEYQSGLLQAIKEAPRYVHNDQYLNYIRKAEIYYTMINHPFPDSILAHTYLRSYSDNKKITLQELLNHYKGEALYIDFWASWCSACRNDIARSYPAKQYLAQKKVIWVYISRDTDEKAWLKAAKHDSITQDQYLLYDVPNSPLLKYFDIVYIPRYVLMNAEHEIKEPTAPRPVVEFGNSLQSVNFDELKRSIQKITEEVKTVTFYSSK